MTHFKIFAISGYCESPLLSSEFLKVNMDELKQNPTAIGDE